MVLKQIAVCIAFGSGSYGLIMFQNWGFTVPEERERQSSDRRNCAERFPARKYSATPCCLLAVSLHSCPVTLRKPFPSLQIQNVVKECSQTHKHSYDVLYDFGGWGGVGG